MSDINHFIVALSEFAGAFTKNNPRKVWTLREGAPEWIDMHAVHVAVDGPSPRLPDDWIFEQTVAVARDIVDREPDDVDEAREAIHEIADSLVDVYNADRSAWLASHLNNAALVDEASDEYGRSEGNTMDAIGLGQYLALTRIAGAIIDQCEARAETLADGA